MSEPEELECTCVLEDNDDFNDAMAKPYGAARQLLVPYRLRPYGSCTVKALGGGGSRIPE